MMWRTVFRIGVVMLTACLVFGSTVPSRAASEKVPARAGSPYDLINAVNALRASFGLAPYAISSILMSTAQSQADFMAATGNMTHSGPGGIGLTDRLLAAGYPLAGDLSLGGFRAENITGGDESMPAESAVDQWTGDALHLNTMASPMLTEIGAGVAINSGRVYYVIDAARSTTAGELPVVATSVDGSSIVSDAPRPELIIPVSVSTPNADGNLFHDVKFGQTLWQIAIVYEVKIDDLKRLNNLSDNNIYPGSSLLIKQGMIVAGSATEAATPLATSTSLPTLTLTPASSMTPAEGTTLPSGVPDSALTRVLLGIIVLALAGGGIFTWLGSSRRR